MKKMKKIAVGTLVTVVLLASSALSKENLVLGNEPRTTGALEPPPIQNPNWGRLPDPSGARTGTTYMRRYLVTASCQVEGGDTRADVYNQDVVKKFITAGANDVKITFVSGDISLHRKMIADMRESGDYNLGLSHPSKGGFLPATDVLKLSGKRVYSRDVKSQRIETPKFSYWKHTVTESVTVILSGIVESIDAGAVAYSLREVKVSRESKGEYYSDIRVKDQLKLPRWVPQFIDVTLAELQKKQRFDPRETEITADALFEASMQLIPTLEHSPAVRVPPRPPVAHTGAVVVLPQSQRPANVELKILGTKMGSNDRVLYLSCKDQVPMGTTVLVPVICDASGRVTRGYVEGKVTSSGYNLTVTLDSLETGYRVDTNGKAYLQ